MNRAHLLQGHSFTVALNRAQLPGRDSKGTLDMARALELINELVENLTRLARLNTNKG
jgi:hypothetical protein